MKRNRVLFARFGIRFWGFLLAIGAMERSPVRAETFTKHALRHIVLERVWETTGLPQEMGADAVVGRVMAPQASFSHCAPKEGSGKECGAQSL